MNIGPEYLSYRSLKQNPLAQDVNYLAAPWIQLLNGNKLKMFPKIKLNGGFTISYHTNWPNLLPLLKKSGVNTIFTPHAYKNMPYKDFNIYPFSHYTKNGVPPAPNKDILFSFVGQPTFSSSNHVNSIRNTIFQLPKAKDAVIVRRPAYHYGLPESVRHKHAKEYKDILSRSRYSLCPRGMGRGTSRFWESLQAGAIPILISDEIWLPDLFDWDSCIIRVSLKDLGKLRAILNNISLEEEEERRKLCLKAHELFSWPNLNKLIEFYLFDYQVN